jgi:hypothetical protein
MEEERLRELREKEEIEKQRRILEQLQFKDVPVKTFYMEYVQKKYRYADIPFPERSAYTVNVTQDMINTTSNMNMNINMNQNIITQTSNIRSNQMNYIQTGNCLCPACGRMTYRINNQIENAENVQSSQNLENNENIEQVENNVNIENEQNIQKTEENVEIQKQECLCPNCENNENNVEIKKEECLCHECEKNENNVQEVKKEECLCHECENNEEIQKKECICPECKKEEIQASA